jgi:hypothetical protein
MIASLGLGIVIGGNLFSRSQPRSVIALTRCVDCLSPKELAGLLASAGIQNTPGLIPLVTVETDKTIAVKLPTRRGVHYVIFPKRDLKDVGDFSEANAPYLIDAYRVVRHLIERDSLSNYSLITNGPGYQSVRYLHFHLQSQ